MTNKGGDALRSEGGGDHGRPDSERDGDRDDYAPEAGDQE